MYCQQTVVAVAVAMAVDLDVATTLHVHVHGTHLFDEWGDAREGLGSRADGL